MQYKLKISPNIKLLEFFVVVFLVFFPLSDFDQWENSTGTKLVMFPTLLSEGFLPLSDTC